MRNIFTLNKRIIPILILLISSYSFSFTQNNDSLRFESQYTKMGYFLDKINDSLDAGVVLMKDNENLTDVQKAKINFLQTRIHDLNELDPSFTETSNVRSASNTLFAQAKAFIIQSRPNMGIPLLLDFIKTVDENSDSAIYAKIYLAEAHRQLKEYRKGVKMLNLILKNDNISQYNRAFAYNRIAAIFDEGGNWISENAYDSVVIYSKRCIKIAEENIFAEHLASSQNELAFIYRKLGSIQLSLEYGLKAVDNFINAKMYPQAMNASINLAKTYSALNKFDKAAETLLNALKLGNVNENKALFMRIYLHLSNACFAEGDFHAAYEYQKIAREMQGDIHNRNIETQIYDMAAKYNLQEKEIKIIEEQQKNRIYSQQKKYLIVIVIISSLLFFILLILFRFKDRAYKNLVQKNLELAICDRKILAEGESIPEQLSTPGKPEKEINTELKKEIDIIKKFNHYLANEKPYLYSDINIEDVSVQLGTNRTYLSKAINSIFNKSFNTIVNEFRVRTARQLLTDSKYAHLSIEGIGEMVGYNSRTVFHYNFKKVTGLTPSYFRESISIDHS